VLHELGERGELGRFAHTGRGPGLARALASVLEELRGEAVEPARIAAEVPELARVFDAYDAALAAAGLADRALVERLAGEAARSEEPAPWLDLPLRAARSPPPPRSSAPCSSGGGARARVSRHCEGDVRAVDPRRCSACAPSAYS
jgi:hypothetical protein